MAILRSFVSFLFASCLFLVLPGFVSAQGVYESQSSGDDHVTIGTHERGASMEKIVALAQRLTGNAELTSEDVLANLPHARRYVCRANGRQIYFGTDPAYGGRCPEGASRFDGVLAGAHYRVPRVHGSVLSPVTRRVTRPATFAPPDPRIAAYESTVEQLEDAMADRDRLQAELASARVDLSQANAALANWPEVRPVAVPAPIAPVAPVAQAESPLHIVLVVLVLLGLFVLVLWLTHFIRTPLLAKIEKLKNENTTLQGKLMEAGSFLRTSEEDCKREEARSRFLAKRRYGLGRLVVYYRQLCMKTGRSLAVAQEMLEELGQFHYRKAKIAETHAKLAELHAQEEPFLRAESLVQEAMAEREDAEHGNDEERVKELDDALRIYEINLRSMGDPQDLRAKINGLVAVLKRDMQLQCGLYFDTRSSDEWRAERDNEQRTLKRELEARVAMYKMLATETVKADAAHVSEKHKLEVELEEYKQLFAAMIGDPEARVKELIAYDQREADLRKRLVDAGLDPGPGTLLYALIAEQHSEDGESFATGVQPPRRPTQAFEALRESQLPAPPSTPTSALSRDIYKTLDTWRSIPPDAWTIECDERAARDWAFFLYNCWISVPRIGLVRLRHLLKEAKTHSPEWLTERARLPTNPPPAAAVG